MAERILKWLRGKNNPSTMMEAARTAVAATLSLLAARLLRLPEAYWSAITTLVVMQSTWGAELPVSAQRFAGLALGAGVGGLVATYYPGNALAFGVAVFTMGILCTAVRVDRAAFRYAGTTLAIVMLIPRTASPWTIAAHRFIEVSIGIAMALAISAVWPEQFDGFRKAGKWIRRKFGSFDSDSG